MEKKWVAPEIEVLSAKETAHGWNAWKTDWNGCGKPIVENCHPCHS